MKLIRRDIEFILKTMDKFKLSQEYDAVEFIHAGAPCGYTLSIKFDDYINNVICKVEVPIEAEMFGTE
jgi:hypothetical protein